MQHLISQFLALFAAWRSLYSESTAVSTTVTTFHLVALLFGGGLAIAADRSTLRAFRQSPEDRARHISELGAVHRPVLIALTVLFVSGVLLTAADLETFLGSPVFWFKMFLVTLLLANGIALTTFERRLSRATVMSSVGQPVINKMWLRLRSSAVLSLALWTVTAVAGAVLVNAG